MLRGVLLDNTLICVRETFKGLMLLLRTKKRVHDLNMLNE